MKDLTAVKRKSKIIEKFTCPICNTAYLEKTEITYTKVIMYMPHQKEVLVHAHFKE